MIDKDDQNHTIKKSQNDFEVIYALFASGKISLPLLVTLMKERTSIENS